MRNDLFPMSLAERNIMAQIKAIQVKIDRLKQTRRSIDGDYSRQLIDKRLTKLETKIWQLYDVAEMERRATILRALLEEH
jgi:hypothetical protein